MSLPARHIHTSWNLFDGLCRVADVASVVGGLIYAHTFASGPDLETMYLAGAAGAVVLLLVGEFVGLYRNWRGTAADREIVCWLIAWLLAMPGLVSLAFMTKHSHEFSRLLVLNWFLVTGALGVLARAALRGVQYLLRAHGIQVQRYAIIGVNDLAIQLARNIEASPELGLQLVGFFDDRPETRHGELPGDVGAKLGDLEAVVRMARNREIDTLYITFPMRAEERIREVLDRLSDTTASVYLVPDFFVFELLHSQWTDIGGLPAVSVFENPFYGVNGFVKRASDLVLATLILLLVGIPMLIIAVAIYCTSPGPIFFRQRRYGLNGEEILVWKFRTMTVCEDGPTVKQATKDDQRVTPLGAFLRRTSLDELPQLFNVLDGSMSLVGPRPHATAHNEEFRHKVPGYMLRHKVKPGITGLAQVNGWRGETDTLEKMERRVECDHQYIREWSLWLDVQILFRTAFVVFGSKNAY